MKTKHLIIAILSLLGLPLSAQTPGPLIIEGQITNSTESRLVHDGYNNWKKALEEDKPERLQLHDAEGMVARAYEANAIPRYILIDKNGNIADMNAPGPSNKEALENKFSEEMSK